MGFDDVNTLHKLNILIISNDDVQDILEIDHKANIDDTVKSFSEKYGIKENGQIKFKSYLQNLINCQNPNHKNGKSNNKCIERLFYNDITKQQIKINTNKLMKERLSKDVECTFSPKITYSHSLKENRKNIKIEDKLLRDGQISKQKKILNNLKRSLQIKDDFDKAKSRNYSIKKKNIINHPFDHIIKDNNLNDEVKPKANLNNSNDKLINNTSTTQFTNKYNNLASLNQKFNLENSLKLSEKGYASKYLQKKSDRFILKGNEKDLPNNENLITESHYQSPNSLKSSKYFNISNINIQNSHFSPIINTQVKSDEISNIGGSINSNLQDNISCLIKNSGQINIKTINNSKQLDSKNNGFDTLQSKSSRNINMLSTKKSLDKKSTNIENPKRNKKSSLTKVLSKIDLTNNTLKGYQTPGKSSKTKKRILINNHDNSGQINYIKETREEFYNRLSSEKKSRSLYNNLMKIKESNNKDTFYKKKSSNRSITPRYLDETLINCRSNLSKELSKNISRKESFEKNVKRTNDKTIDESLKKFRLSKLKETFEMIYKYVDNIEEIDILYRYGIPTQLIDHLIKPTCYIMQTKNLEFNFQNFYEIADEILQLLVI